MTDLSVFYDALRSDECPDANILFDCWNPVLFFKDKRGFYRPCGKCPGCRRSASREWALRLQSEAVSHSSMCFLTLTYSDEFLPEGGNLCIRDMQLFNKRVRKYYGSFRYFFVGEYGEEHDRPHYHELIFGLPSTLDFSRFWKFGFLTVDDVTDARIAYVAGYVEKKFIDGRGVDYYEQKNLVLPFHRMSLKPGIGDAFYRSRADFLNNRGYDVLFGKKVPLSSYFIRHYASDDLKARRMAAFEVRSDEIASVSCFLADQRLGIVEDVWNLQRVQKERDFKSYLARRKKREPG